MHRKLLNQYFKTDGWVTPTIGQKSVDNSNTPSYNKDIGNTTYDLDDAWKSDHEQELRYAGDSARESVDKGLKETKKFMKDAPEGTNYSDVQSASVKWSLANDTNNKELKQSAFDELTGLLSTENKEEYLKKARPLQEFVDAKDTFDYQRKNYTTTKNSTQRFDQAVQNLQHKLNEKGYTDKFGEKLKEDGIYGGKTRFAEDSYVNSIHQITDKDNSTPKIQNLFLSADTPKPKLEKAIGNPEDIKNTQPILFASRGGTRNTSKTRGISSQEMAEKEMYIKPLPPKSTNTLIEKPSWSDKIKDWCEDTFVAEMLYSSTASGEMDEFYEMVGFTRTDDGVFHARKDAWQKYFGYNDLYDTAFNLGTDMKSNKYEFECNGTKYTFWLWKGDYLNLGMGTEVGIYKGDKFHLQCATDIDIPIDIELFCGIDKIVDYTESTWWCTGFNPKYHNIDSSNLALITTIDFSNHPKMFNAFMNRYNGNDNLDFDKDTLKVRIRF